MSGEVLSKATWGRRPLAQPLDRQVKEAAVWRWQHFHITICGSQMDAHWRA
jgi:hypothetical protein